MIYTARLIVIAYTLAVTALFVGMGLCWLASDSYRETLDLVDLRSTFEHALGGWTVVAALSFIRPTKKAVEELHFKPIGGLR